MSYRAVVLAVALSVVATAAVGATEVVALGDGATGLGLDVGDRGAETLTVAVSEVRLDAVEIDGVRWAAVTVPGGHSTMQRGEPSLPVLSRSYLLGAEDGVQLRLEELTTREIHLGGYGFAGVAPSKGHVTRDIPYDDVPWTFDPKIYGGDASFPADLAAAAGAPYIAGPVRGQTVMVPVASWNPVGNVLTVVTSASYSVARVPGAANPRTRPAPALSAPFAAVARDALNADTELPAGGRSVEPGRLLILADDTLVSAVEPLAAWETLVGYPTLLVTESQAGVASANDIKAYLQGLYDEPEGLAWIILVGDAPQIPTLLGVNESAHCDPCYTKLEGNDNRPDAAISRLSGNTPAEIQVQVDKILSYEQAPSVAPGGDGWYGAAFGIASNEGSPADYQRMNDLRDTLLPGGYTEFTELYDGHFPWPSGSGSPTPANVAAAVNLGTSLGFYIGHGSDTAWVSSGFSVSDVNSRLTNGDMLPVVWDVACVNGTYHRTGGDCFAEAWMKKSGGGAVSFEAATTNESWVPPCIAQAGVVDTIVDRSATTTGAQHVAGKIALMDSPEGGDSNGSEGTMFMEQSHLFGACTMWPRTGPASVPDEPADFAVAGGVASLTVTVDGTPLAVAGGAIVSFYDKVGDTVVPMGAGLVNAAGLVEAPVTGDPTWCHIHGLNLVPTEFELAARPAGRVSLDSATYSCAGTAGLRVVDSNVYSVAPPPPATLDVTLSNGADDVLVSLQETEPGSGFYVGDAALGVDLAVAHGDTLTATYHDLDDGQGGSHDAMATATVDCAGPVLSDVAADASESRITFSFSSDEPGTTVVHYGPTPALGSTITDDGLTTDHQLVVDGVDPCTGYYFTVASADGLGNLGSADDGGTPFTVETDGWRVFLDEGLATDPGWGIDNGSHQSTGWAWGVPTGQGQDDHGAPDPTSGASGVAVYGVNLDGDISPDLATDEQTLTTPPIDLTEAISARLRFQRWLGVESNSYDHARIRVSTNGGSSWTTVWQNGTVTIDDTAWGEMVVDLPAAVLGEADVRIQWTYGASDGLWNYCGWNLDDVVVEGATTCDAPPAAIFNDGFEGGSCAAWSVEVTGL